MQKSLISTFLVLLLSVAIVSAPVQVAAAPALHHGATGGDVWDVQYRLIALGYLDGPMDGFYSAKTASAMSHFQKAYGLEADGITGPRTWNVLRRNSLNLYEMDIMAKVIYSEARGESYKGQVAVGAVVMNRIQSNQFPNHIRGVVFQPGAFTAVSDGQFWLKPDTTAYKAAIDAVRGWDPTHGSLFYFNPVTATSKWIWSRPQNVKIGNHIFTD